ncbi:MAG TPA: cupin domain-containing protein [Bryobacteraceae bacterium]|nr:cupin domain-containing protein [Bryobacteraceae bacterium]
MLNRRDAIASALALLSAAATADAQNSPARGGGGSVFKQDLPNVSLDGWEVTVSEIDMPPGRVGMAHRHPGFVLAYVLEGEIRTKISDQPETVYKKGQMFYEWPGSVHRVSANASKTEPAKLLAMVFAKKGVPLVMPADSASH